MGFRNPIVLADEVTSGNFAGQYTIAGLMTIGNPAAAHVAIGADAHGANGVRLYAADGVTPLIDLKVGAPSVAGSVVAGAVASATSATNATNLAGGGVASGSTAIQGSLVVGNAAASHVVVGSDALGANGVRLYASDGVTPLIDLSTAGTPTITGALIRTAASGRRVALSSTVLNALQLWTGQAITETQPGMVASFTVHDGGANAQGALGLSAPQWTLPTVLAAGEVDVYSEANDSSLPARVDFRAGRASTTVKTASWDGTTFSVPGMLSAAANLTPSTWNPDNGYFVDGLNGFYTRFSDWAMVGGAVHIHGYLIASAASVGRLALYSFAYTGGGGSTTPVHFGSLVAVGSFVHASTCGVALLDNTSGKILLFTTAGTYVGDAGHPVANGDHIEFSITLEAA